MRRCRSSHLAAAAVCCAESAFRSATSGAAGSTSTIVTTTPAGLVCFRTRLASTRSTAARSRSQPPSSRYFATSRAMISGWSTTSETCVPVGSSILLVAACHRAPTWSRIYSRPVRHSSVFHQVSIPLRGTTTRGKCSSQRDWERLFSDHADIFAVLAGRRSSPCGGSGEVPGEELTFISSGAVAT
jgi:hypothetical protein